MEARKNGPFLSKDEILKRTQLSTTCFKLLEQLGVFKDLNEENQLQFQVQETNLNTQVIIERSEKYTEDSSLLDERLEADESEDKFPFSSF